MNGWRDSMYLVTFGLALVLLMATVLFFMVGINPKQGESTVYGWWPWVYSGLSAVGSGVCWVVSGRLARPQEVSPDVAGDRSSDAGNP